MATTNLGKVSLTTGGAWNSGTNYTKLTLVTHNGIAYVSRTSSQAIEPGVTAGWANYWMELVSGIVSVTGPVSVGNVDTYTFNLADGTSTSFSVTNGVDGVSPTAVISKVGDTATITITDDNGTTSANITDGAAAGFGTPTAVATTVPAGTPAYAAVTASGANTSKVFNFSFDIPQGEKGDTGNGLTILGYYATLADLQADVPNPNPGDAYGIGASAPYDIYVWDDVNSAWTDNGNIQGPQGDAATITVGTVTTLPAGSAATVTNGGTSSAAILNFGIPIGNTGADGSTGATGATGPAGPAAGFGVPTASASGLPAGSSPTVSVTTDAGSPNTAKIFNFTFGIPKGDQGDQGATGNDGPNVLSTSTATAFTGLVKGNGATVAQATAGTDYAEVFYAEAEMSGSWASSSTTVSFSTTFNDIKNAYQADKIVILKLSVSGSSYYYRLPLIRYASNQVRFSGYIGDDLLAVIMLTSGNVATYAYDVNDEVCLVKGTMSGGISGATECVMDTDWQTVKDAYDAGKLVFLYASGYNLPVRYVDGSTIAFSGVFSTQAAGVITWNKSDADNTATSITYRYLQKAIHQDGSLIASLEGMLKCTSDGDGGYKAAAATIGTDYVAPYIATGTLTSLSSPPVTVTISDTFANVKTAYTNNKQVILRLTYSTHTYELPLVHYSTTSIRFSAMVTATQMLSVEYKSSGSPNIVTTVITLS